MAILKLLVNTAKGSNIATVNGSLAKSITITSSIDQTFVVPIYAAPNNGYSFSGWTYSHVPTGQVLVDDYGIGLGISFASQTSQSTNATIRVNGNLTQPGLTITITLTANAGSSPVPPPATTYSANSLNSGYYRHVESDNPAHPVTVPSSQQHGAVAFERDTSVASSTCYPTQGQAGTTITFSCSMENDFFQFVQWEVTGVQSNSSLTSKVLTAVMGSNTAAHNNVLEARPVYELKTYDAKFNPDGGTWNSSGTGTKTTKYQWTPISLIKNSHNYIDEFNPVIYASSGSYRLGSDPYQAPFHCGDLSSKGQLNGTGSWYDDVNQWGAKSLGKSGSPFDYRTAGTDTTGATNLFNYYLGNGQSEKSWRTSQNLSTNYYDETVSKTGYTFDNWTVTSSGSEEHGSSNWALDYSNTHTPKYILGSAAGKYGDVEFTAQWTPITYKVNIQLNGGSQSVSAGTIVDVGSNCQIANPSSSTDLAFDLSNITPSQGSVTAIRLTPPTKTGYKFIGWKFENLTIDSAQYYSSSWVDFTSSTQTLSVTGNMAVRKLRSSSGTVTITAQYEPITYTVSYDGNGNSTYPVTGSTSSSTHTYDAQNNLASNGFSRTGFTFSGWNSKADGTGVHYSNGQTNVGNLSSTQGATVNLYAEWTANTYTISYNLDGGTRGSSHPTSGTFASELTISNPTKDGFAFLGWIATGLDTSTAKTGTSSATTSWSGSSTTNTKFLNLRSTSGTVTFTATWESVVPLYDPPVWFKTETGWKKCSIQMRKYENGTSADWVLVPIHIKTSSGWTDTD